MNATAIRDEHFSAATVNAVIIYDRFDLASKAKAMLERAAHRTDETIHWRFIPWRVDVLKLPPAAETALAEAAEAHLIVLAVSQVQSLFRWLVDWLERWATCRQVQEAALAVWDGGNGDTRRAQEIRELSQFAGRHGLSLVLEDKSLVPDKSSTLLSDLRKREVFMTATLQRILAKPVRDHYDHWGIND
jgi:hypothetical protein